MEGHWLGKLWGAGKCVIITARRKNRKKNGEGKRGGKLKANSSLGGRPKRR